MDSITLAEVRVLQEAGAIRGVTIYGKDHVFRLIFHIGEDRMTLAGTDGKVRQFKKPDAAINLLKELGIKQGTIDLENYDFKPAADDKGTKA